MKHLVIGCVLVLSCGGLHAQEGSLDASFNPTDIGYGFGEGTSAEVHDVLVQNGNKILLADEFRHYNANDSYCVARCNADGTIDHAFDPGNGAGANNEVHVLTAQPDGKVLFSGDFTSYDYTTRNKLARMNADGSVDPTFSPGSGVSGVTFPAVNAIAVQTDGKILIGGGFTAYNGTARNHFARLNADGSLDSGFDPQPGSGGAVGAIAVQGDGKIIIAGSFTSYNGTPINRIARLNSDGSLDAGFSPGTGASGIVEVVALQSDGKILIGGSFSTFNGTTRRGIARLNTNGSLDAGFAPTNGSGTAVYDLLVQPDGKILMGGAFGSVNGNTANYLARLNADGSSDAGFNTGSGASSFVRGIDRLTDGRIAVVGDFTTFNGASCNHIALLQGDGSSDTAFNLGTGACGFIDPNTGGSGGIQASAVGTNGNIVIGGRFLRYNGVARTNIARVLPDGNLDTSFDPGAGTNDNVIAVAIQPDNKVLLAGSFSTYNSSSRFRIARANADGSNDASFIPGNGPNGNVYGILVQPDGKILIWGPFTSYASTARNGIARLNANGSLDMGFNPGSGFVGGVVNGLAVQPDGKILVCGMFTAFNGSSRKGLARLNADGTLDTSLDPGTGVNQFTGISSLALQPDGKIMIVGSFTSYGGTARGHIARANSDGSLDLTFNPGSGTLSSGDISGITLQPDGKSLITGVFDAYNGTGRRYLARVNTNGSLDTSFDPGTGFLGAPYDSHILPDGRIIITGGFIAYNGTGRNRIARINGTPRAGIKLMLEGPYSGTTMNDALRTLPSFPLIEPFTAMGYAETGYVSGSTIGTSVLTTTGNNAIVDWVIIEMRPVATPGTVAASRAVLLQRDGDVVDLDGVSTIGFAGLAAGNYCVAVKPRNHLPVMLSATTPVSYGSAIATVDFTLPTTQVYDNDARKNVSGVMVLAAGDVTFNETVGYTGAGNDRDPILTRVGSSTPNNSVGGYWREDVNMDGLVKYTGSANDRDIILTNVGSTTPNNTRVATLP